VPPTQKLPPGHEVQSAAAASPAHSPHVPPGHSAGAVAAAQKLPTGHADGVLALPAAVVPAGVGRHADDPALGWYVSGGHPVGADEPAGQSVPGGHRKPAGGTGTAVDAPLTQA
jgi:hypothetical protein